MLGSYQGPPDEREPALGLALCELQAADVLEPRPVLAHLLVDDQLHTPAGRERSFRTLLWNPLSEQPPF